MSSFQCSRPADQNYHQGQPQQHGGPFGLMLGSVIKPLGGHSHQGSMTSTGQPQCYPQTHPDQHMNHSHSMGKPANLNGNGYSYVNPNSNGYGYGNGHMDHSQPIGKPANPNGHGYGNGHMNHNQSMGKPANSNGHGYSYGNHGMAHYTSQTDAAHAHAHAQGGSAACQGKTHRRRGLFRRLKDGLSGDSSGSDSDSDSGSDSDNQGCRRNRANRC